MLGGLGIRPFKKVPGDLPGGWLGLELTDTLLLLRHLLRNCLISWHDKTNVVLSEITAVKSSEIHWYRTIKESSKKRFQRMGRLLNPS